MGKLLVWLAMVLPIVLQCAAQPAREPHPMSDHSLPATPSRLPWEPNSPSEILAASHILVVTMREVVASAWVTQPSGLEQRELLLRVRLDAILKGEVRFAAGTKFPVKVAQVREPGGVISDYHGFWSEVEPASGASYLVLSSARTDDPSQLMQEPAIRMLVPSALQSDVALAATTEERFAPQLVNSATRETALLELLKIAAQRRETIGVLAPPYFLARLSGGDLRGGPLATAILETVLAPDTAPALRSVFATGLCNAALDQGATPGQRAEIARSLFGLAAVKSATDLFERLVSADLYNLIFETDAPALKASDVISDEAERTRLATKLKQFDEERADEIAAWLRHR